MTYVYRSMAKNNKPVNGSHNKPSASRLIFVWQHTAGRRVADF